MIVSASKIPSNQNNIPVAITYSNLPSGITSVVQEDGDDLRFTDADPSGAHNKLAADLVHFSKSGTSGEVWVKSDWSSSADNEIWISAGNGSATFPTKGGGADGEGFADPEDVWLSTYLAVYHLTEAGDGAAGEYKDATSNDSHIQGGGGTSSYCPTKEAGKLGSSQTFDGIDDFITGNDYAAAGHTLWTEVLIKPLVDADGDDNKYIVGDSSQYYVVAWDHVNVEQRRAMIYHGSTGWEEAAVPGTPAHNVWHYMTAGVTTADHAKANIDGVEGTASSVTSVPSEPGALLIGKGNAALPCEIDELRFRDTEPDIDVDTIVWGSINDSDFWQLSELYTGTIDQSPTGIAKNTYVKIATVSPTENTLTVTISAEGSDPGDVVVADNIGISLTPP